jgi:predicted DNA-binding transcriptional regulator AlpA
VDDPIPALSHSAVCSLLTEIRDLLSGPARPVAELLTREEVAVVLNVGLSTFDRLRATGRVGPQPLEFAGVRFLAAEVRAWLMNRDHRGELHDADAWPAVWATLQTRPRGTRR